MNGGFRELTLDSSSLPDDYDDQADNSEYIDEDNHEEFESMELSSENDRQKTEEDFGRGGLPQKDLESVYDLLLRILKILEDQAKYDLGKIKRKS